MKAEELKIEINAILHNVLHNKITLTATLRSILLEKIKQHASEVSREKAIKLLPWYEGTSHKHKGKTWIDIYDDGIKWIKEQEEQP